MQAQALLKKTIGEKFIQLQSKNKMYSLRAFSKRLGIHPAALSEILNGKRQVSKQLALKLIDRLGIGPTERAQIDRAFSASGSSSKRERLDYGRREIELDHYYIVSEWHYYAILSLSETKDFKSDSKWISERLGISKRTVEQAIKRLLERQLLKKTKTGRLKSTGSFISTDEVENLSLQKRHEENLDSAKEALFQNQIADRDYTFMTMAIDPSKIPLAKKAIRKFQNEMCEILENPKSSEVYELCVQLFPRTLIKKNGGKNE